MFHVSYKLLKSTPVYYPTNLNSFPPVVLDIIIPTNYLRIDKSSYITSINDLMQGKELRELLLPLVDFSAVDLKLAEGEFISASLEFMEQLTLLWDNGKSKKPCFYTKSNDDYIQSLNYYFYNIHNLLEFHISDKGIREYLTDGECVVFEKRTEHISSITRYSDCLDLDYLLRVESAKLR